MSVPRHPREAPPRPDLTYLRHRTRPPAPAPAPPPPPPVPVTERRPAATSSLDLGSPAPPAPGSSLDLGPPSSAAPASPEPTAPTSTRHEPLPVRDARRVTAGSPAPLTSATPTVTLTRIQSGTGALELVLARPASAGDLALGCVFQLADGTEAVVQELGGNTAGPPGTPLPVVRWKGRADGESLTVDLRQVTALRRALVYGYSPSISVLSWSGVVVVTTYGDARIEVPIESPPFSGTLALLTIYNVDGELVLRSEMDPHHGPPEMAAVAFDHHLPWLDGRTPLR